MPRLTEFRSFPKLVLLLLVIATESAAIDNFCPTPASRPDLSHVTLPTQTRTLKPYSITETVAHYYDAPLGVGFLEVIEDEKG